MKFKFNKRETIYAILHLVILVISLFLVFRISIDTYENKAFYKEPDFIGTQLKICLVFLADYFIELFMAEKKWRFFVSHFFFLLVSIPYLSIIHHFGWTFSPEVTYLLRFVPLIRGGYALAIVVGWFTSNRAASLTLTYFIILIASVYFGSLVFYVVEHDVNAGVATFGDALWWAAMDTVTTGSNIMAVTPVGRILSVALSCLGMMMLPLFTVYVTTLIQNRNKLLSSQNTTPTAPQQQSVDKKE